MHHTAHSLAALLAATFPLLAQTWQPAAPSASPPARLATALVTDVGTGRCLLFGGSPGSGYLGDTWRFDGSTWTALPGTGPSARANHAMAFDSQRGMAVLFGGINGVAVSSYQFDTWEHDGTAWHQRVVATHPSARFDHAMAFDPLRGVVVLFGGRTNAGTVFLNDTWEWNGTAWTGRLPTHSPARRMGHAMAFDAASGRTLLVGGQPIGALPLNDTWAWDGTDWVQLAPTHSPSPRTQAAMASDPARGRVVLYGGYSSGDVLDTLEWDGSDWHSVPTAVQPDAPGLPAMATGPAGHHVVLFGGELGNGPALAATWRFGAFAGAQPFGTGCGASPLQLSANAGSTPVLGQGFTSRVDALPANALPFLSFGLSDATFGALPLPLELSALGMPGCWLYHDMVALGFACTPAGSGAVQTLPLPATGALAGMRLFAQGYALALGANAAGLLTSNALALSLGF